MTIPLASGLIAKYEELQESFIVMEQAFAPLNLTKLQLARMFAAQLWRDSPIWMRFSSSVVLGTLLLVFLDTYILYPYLFSLRRLGIPQLKPSQGKHAFDYKPMLDLAAENYPDRPWFFTYSGFELVVFPSRYVDEIRRLKASTASLVDFLTTVQFGGYKLIGTDESSNTLHATASTDLARSIGPLSFARQESAGRAWDTAVGPSTEWKTLSLFWTVLDVVVATGATGLVGEPLSRDPRWLKAVRRFPVAVGAGVLLSCNFPRLLRPIAAKIFYTPALVIYRWMTYLLGPTIEQAILEGGGSYKQNGNGVQKHDKKLTLVHFLLGRYKPGQFNRERLIKDVITATFESTPTTAVSLYWMMTELLTNPEIVDDLREELAGVVQDGNLPATQLNELPKMDSFMRESARFNTFHYLGLSRILQKPHQFSVGPELPKGTIICVDQDHIHNSHDIYHNPEEFDYLRFYRKRQQAGHENGHQYTSNGPELLTWGDGPQVCPGRVFAGNTIKILISNLLLNYDIQFPAGTYKPGRLSFPNGSVQPDMKTQFMVRRKVT